MVKKRGEGGGAGGWRNRLCNNKIYSIPLKALPYSNDPPHWQLIVYSPPFMFC